MEEGLLQQAVAAASELLEVTHQRGSQAQLRNGFVARDVSSQPLPPATELLRHSGKGGLQLRMALVFIWLAGPRVDGHVGLPPYTVRLPVRTLARFMGLHQGLASDRRRIRENATSLAMAGFIDVVAIRDEIAITLLRDLPTELRSSDTPYFRPGIATTERDPRLDAYLTLPSSFFTDGWLTLLTPAALTVFLAFRYLNQTKLSTDQGLFISEHLRQERFGFSERTYYAGSLELATRGLVKSWSQHVRGPTAEGPRKVRRVFAIRRGLFDGWLTPEPTAARSDMPTSLEDD